MEPDGKNQENTKAAMSPNSLLTTQAQAETFSCSGSTCQGIIGLMAFLVLSAAALWAVPLQTSVPQEIRTFLGAAPPVRLLNIALAVYFSCALIQILPRTLDSQFRYKGWSHIAYLSGFYFFYFFAQALEGNLPALFAIGAVLLTFEIVALQLRRRRSLVSNEE